MQSLKKLIFIGIAAVLVVLSSCRYDYITFEEPPLNDTVYFASQIEPIFNDNDNCTACHNTGGQTPDLTTGNAFSSIQAMNLVNVTDPESSILYTEPDPNNTSVHSWKKYTPQEASLVLTWIKQGALNNK